MSICHHDFHLFLCLDSTCPCATIIFHLFNRFAHSPLYIEEVGGLSCFHFQWLGWCVVLEKGEPSENTNPWKRESHRQPLKKGEPSGNNDPWKKESHHQPFCCFPDVYFGFRGSLPFRLPGVYLLRCVKMLAHWLGCFEWLDWCVVFVCNSLV